MYNVYIYIYIYVCVSDWRCGVLQATDKITGWGMIDVTMGVGFQPQDTCLTYAPFAIHTPPWRQPRGKC